MEPKNYGKDISSVNTPIRFHLSNCLPQFRPFVSVVSKFIFGNEKD